MTPDDARRQARITLGSVVQITEQARDIRAGARLEQILHDIRQAAKLRRRTPGFTPWRAAGSRAGVRR